MEQENIVRRKVGRYKERDREKERKRVRGHLDRKMAVVQLIIFCIKNMSIVVYLIT